MLRHLPPVVDAQVLVGAALADDAAVYQISPEVALVATIDYITPVVDDAYTWGGIAAANALSDVYAMGARPIFALNVVNFPRDTLPLEVLEQACATTQDPLALRGPFEALSTALLDTTLRDVPRPALDRAIELATVREAPHTTHDLLLNALRRWAS